jgi:signal transduction histidine kinase/CheY-like chemotaxis protein
MRSSALVTRSLLGVAGAAAGLLFVIGLTVLANWMRIPLAAYWLTVPALIAVAYLTGAWPAVLMLLGVVAWTATPWLPPAPAAEIDPFAFLFMALGGVLLALIVAKAGTARQRKFEELLGPGFLASREGVRSATFLLLLACTPLVLLIAICWVTFQEGVGEGRSLALRTAEIGREQAQRVFETNGLVARQLNEVLGSSGDTGLGGREAAISQMLGRLTQDMPQVQSVWLFDADGNVLASSLEQGVGRNSRDRDYFAAHAAHHVEWYLSEPLIGRMTGTPFFALSTARRDADGRLRGVIATTMYQAYFEAYYKELAGNAEGVVVALVRRDGAIIASSQGTDDPESAAAFDALGPALKAGEQSFVAERASHAKEGESILALAGIRGFPAAVVSGVPYAAILAKQSRIVAIPAILVSFGTLLLLAATLVALRYHGAQARTFARFQEMSAAREQAERAAAEGQKMEALGRLTGGVAHDINNMLSVVANNAALLGELNPAFRESAPMRSIMRAVTSSARMLGQLVTFSGQQPAELQDLSPGEVVSALLDLVRAAVGSGVEIDGRNDAPQRRVKADATELERAILNIAVNAKDAMPEGGRLTITVREATDDELPDHRSTASSPWVVIEVSDTGHGMPADVARRAFEPFFTTKQRSGGSGLGLSQVYGFCVQAGGVARMRSSLGAGTTVSMYLPCIEPAALRAFEIGTNGGDALAGLRVLLVEDNHELAQGTASLLKSLGCAVELQHDAAAALECVEAGGVAVDVVVSDILMPGRIDGHEFAVEMRRRYPDVPVILVTAYATQAAAARRAGFVVLTKPCPVTALAKAISKAVVRRPAGESVPD